MLRLLLTRRWAVRILAGLVLAAACVWLGLWQLDRNEQRQARNAIIETNMDQAPVPVDEVLSPGRPVSAADEWTIVETSGDYDMANQLALRLRPLRGRSGVHVLTPLVTDSGAAVLVDRGFVPTAGGTAPDELPAASGGRVSVTGRVRPSEQGRSTGADPSSGAIRYVDIAALAEAFPYQLYGGWLELTEQAPAPSERLEPIPPPQTEAGPHLSYALQWFTFAVIGVGGFVVLVRAEARARREHGDTPSTRHVGERTGSGTG